MSEKIEYTKTVDEATEKYGNIEDKIPSVWPSYQKAGEEMARDIAFFWNISDPELIRVISLVSIYGKIPLTKHIDPMMSYAALYPEKMKGIYEMPSTKSTLREKVLAYLVKKRKEKRG